MASKRVYHVAIGWAHPCDKYFVSLLKKLLNKKRISFLEITCENLLSIVQDIHQKKIFFKRFINLSYIDNPLFFTIAKKLKSLGSLVINDPDKLTSAFSKTFLHRQFDRARLPLPQTEIISPRKYRLHSLKLLVHKMDIPFVIKPTYHFQGVVPKYGHHVNDIVGYLKKNPASECLIQEYIVPGVIKGKMAWFRSICVCGVTIHHWWDPLNHFYKRFGPSAQEKEIAKQLDGYLQKIAKLTGLDLFSTEITMNQNGKFMIIDYANHPIDLRSQESDFDGVPKKTLSQTAKTLVDTLNCR